MWWTQRRFTSFQSACQNTDLHLAPTTGTVWSFDYSNCSHPIKKQQESWGERGAAVSSCQINIWKNILQCSMFYHTTTYRGEFAWPALHKLKCLQHSAKLLNETCSRTYQRPMTQSISTVWSAQLISVEVSRGDLGFPLFSCETLRPFSDDISPVIPVNMCGGRAPCKAAGPSASEWPAKTAGRLSRFNMPLPVKTFKMWSNSGL